MDELDAQRSELNALARLRRPQVDQLVEPPLAQLCLDEAERQRRAVDRDRRPRLQLRQDVGQPADVVLVAVGDDDRPQVAQPLLDVADVGDDQVDSALLLLRELAAAVEQDQVALVLDGGHVLADLADPAERDHPQPAPRSPGPARRFLPSARPAPVPLTAWSTTVPAGSLPSSTLGAGIAAWPGTRPRSPPGCPPVARPLVRRRRWLPPLRLGTLGGCSRGVAAARVRCSRRMRRPMVMLHPLRRLLVAPRPSPPRSRQRRPLAPIVHLIRRRGPLALATWLSRLGPTDRRLLSGLSGTGRSRGRSPTPTAAGSTGPAGAALGLPALLAEYSLGVRLGTAALAGIMLVCH